MEGRPLRVGLRGGGQNGSKLGIVIMDTDSGMVRAHPVGSW